MATAEENNAATAATEDTVATETNAATTDADTEETDTMRLGVMPLKLLGRGVTLARQMGLLLL